LCAFAGIVFYAFHRHDHVHADQDMRTATKVPFDSGSFLDAVLGDCDCVHSDLVGCEFI
jgi:hypothetical protein